VVSMQDKERKMFFVPYTQYAVELRSGKIISIDESFEELFGYTQEDVDAGLVFKNLVPCVEYEEMIDEMREAFITKKCICYQHGVIRKDNSKIQVVSFFTIQNKLLHGHRVLEVGVAEITDIIDKKVAESRSIEAES